MKYRLVPLLMIVLTATAFAQRGGFRGGGGGGFRGGGFVGGGGVRGGYVGGGFRGGFVSSGFRPGNVVNPGGIYHNNSFGFSVGYRGVDYRRPGSVIFRSGPGFYGGYGRGYYGGYGRGYYGGFGGYYGGFGGYYGGYFPTVVAVGYSEPYPVPVYSGYASDPYYSGDRPPVIINQNFVPDRARPEVRNYVPAPDTSTLPPAPPYQPSVAAPAPQERSDSSYYLLAMPNGSVVIAVAYWTRGPILHYVTRQKEVREIALSAIDRDLTEQLNRERGIRMRFDDPPVGPPPPRPTVR